MTIIPTNTTRPATPFDLTGQPQWGIAPLRYCLAWLIAAS
jgi:hypothetical protein